MAFFDNTDINLDSIPSTFEEFHAYLFPDQTSALSNGEVNDQASITLPYDWGLVEQPEFIVGSSTGLQAVPNHEPAALANFDMTQVNGYGWPAVGQQTQTYHPDFWSLGDLSAGTTAGTCTALPGPSSVPFDYPWTNQNEPSANTFYAGNVDIHYQPSAGPTRTGPILTGRFQPYGMSRVQLNERRNVEAGPSTPVPPSVLYDGLPAPQPSGWIPETTADAGKNHTATEDDKVTMPRWIRFRGDRSPPPESGRKRVDAYKLCKWAERHLDLSGVPTFGTAIAAAAQFIPTIKRPVYTEPCLLTGAGRRTVVGKPRADREYERRRRERMAYLELSKYYQRKQGEYGWTHVGLLSQVVESLENYRPRRPASPPLPEPSGLFGL